jgi:hypothetical protein
MVMVMVRLLLVNIVKALGPGVHRGDGAWLGTWAIPWLPGYARFHSFDERSMGKSTWAASGLS